ncbi:unnamed protein product [Acanthosepion pharaonis]|uniref:Uncharacterized protein n=1 Tax=Acanthosepion pharaonis TaxID=158019 RepID=A0A812B5J6_ACAPH|nr:unnamed protein product [Sepia pharaonis]
MHKSVADYRSHSLFVLPARSLGQGLFSHNHHRTVASITDTSVQPEAWTGINFSFRCSFGFFFWGGAFFFHHVVFDFQIGAFSCVREKTLSLTNTFSHLQGYREFSVVSSFGIHPAKLCCQHVTVWLIFVNIQFYPISLLFYFYAFCEYRPFF